MKKRKKKDIFEWVVDAAAVVVVVGIAVDVV